MKIFLDNNSTTIIKPAVKMAMIESLDIFGNPTSTHFFGQKATAAIEASRRKIAMLMHVRPEQVVFTSGGTESNVTALNGIMDLQPSKRFVTNPMEHSSVYETAWAMHEKGIETTFLSVDNNGIIDLEELETELAKGDVGLVAIMYANNETGVLNPVEKIGKICCKYKVPFHVDAVQGGGKIDIDFNASRASSMSIAFHKFGGPKGVGALILQPELRMRALLTGGGQERGRRSGTENVLGIIGAGKAAEIAINNFDSAVINNQNNDANSSDYNFDKEIIATRNHMEEQLKTFIPQLKIVGENVPRVANTSMFIVPNIESQIMIMAMDMAEIAISAGSACSSGKTSPSRILMALGYSKKESVCGLRISLGWQNTREDVDKFLQKFAEFISKNAVK